MWDEAGAESGGGDGPCGGPTRGRGGVVCVPYAVWVVAVPELCSLAGPASGPGDRQGD